MRVQSSLRTVKRLSPPVTGRRMPHNSRTTVTSCRLPVRSHGLVLLRVFPVQVSRRLSGQQVTKAVEQPTTLSRSLTQLASPPLLHLFPDAHPWQIKCQQHLATFTGMSSPLQLEMLFSVKRIYFYRGKACNERKDHCVAREPLVAPLASFFLSFFLSPCKLPFKRLEYACRRSESGDEADMTRLLTS